MQKEITTTIIVDDLDGTEEASTRTFQVNDTVYEIDLTDSNQIDLTTALSDFTKTKADFEEAQEVLSVFIDRARSVIEQADASPEEYVQPEAEAAKQDEVAEQRTKKSTKPRKSSRRKAASQQPTPREVRAWAIENDVPVSKTGRVSKTTVQAYLEAHAA